MAYPADYPVGEETPELYQPLVNDDPSHLAGNHDNFFTLLITAFHPLLCLGLVCPGNPSLRDYWKVCKQHSVQ